ncbi:polysaccharide pyruvyl transferase family protein [Clostridium sp.]|uniref:polysaccharide pyruvyl transferase family protein n=1 Tax=Clostridium sp. TaxID=1506 RepID=UPI003995D812
MNKKIGILTFHNAVNYGAILQCYALQNALEQRGYNVEVIDYTPLYFNKVFFDPLKPWEAIGTKNKLKSLIKVFLRFRQQRNNSIKQFELKQFVKKYLKISETVDSELISTFDSIIAGSDQVWNLELLENDTTYLLDFPNDVRRVSYAASFKVSDVDEFAIDAYKKYLPKFNNISVREENLKVYLKNNLNIDSTNVLDPTFLLNMKKWSELINNKRLIEEKYVLVYHVNQPVELVSKALEYAKKNSYKVVSLNRLNTKDDYIDFSYASIEEFLNLVKNAEVVFTTSFHGMAFSINFQKEFYFEIPEKSYNNNERLLDLAKKLKLMNRNISNGLDENPINWESVTDLLDKYVENSNEFLNYSLNNEEMKKYE